MRCVLIFVRSSVVALALAAVACSGSAASQAQPPQRGGTPAAVPVTATAAVRKSMPLEAAVVGTVEAFSTGSVRAQITGEVTAGNFQHGDDVKAGQELVTLHRRPPEAAMSQA